jgi:formylglycine-generating enzyme
MGADAEALLRQFPNAGPGLRPMLLAETPAHPVTVRPFLMDRYEVTNAGFQRFLRARPAYRSQWRGPKPAEDAADRPVTFMTWDAAAAYAAWAGKRLPTEAEWEFAARGGEEDAEFAWGDELQPGGKMMANTWQGRFPWQNLAQDGYERTSPVGAFPPNDYGLHDMIGNVWEWSSDWFSPRHQPDAAKPCCIPKNPRGGEERQSYDPCQPESRIPRKVLKGGSYLCAPNYCRRYRPAARHPQTVDTSACHVGFRCIARNRPKLSLRSTRSAL